MKQTFTDSFVLSLCLILVLLSVLSNCHNPIELIVTTCACGAVYQVVPVYQCTSVPGTHRTFPRFARAAIDSHVQHDSLTRTKIFSSKSAAVIFRQEARGRGGLGNPYYFLFGCIWGKLGCRGKLELGGRLRLWKKQLRFNFCHLPFPSNTREKPSLRRSIRCQSSHNWTPATASSFEGVVSRKTGIEVDSRKQAAFPLPLPIPRLHSNERGMSHIFLTVDKTKRVYNLVRREKREIRIGPISFLEFCSIAACRATGCPTYFSVPPTVASAERSSFLPT